MKKTHNVLLAKKNAKGEYLKNKDGKSLYENFGFIAIDDKGYKKLCLKTFQGDVWFSLFEIKDDDKNQEQPQQDESNNDLDNEIPFN